jgi:hypothetical protein
MTLRPYSRDFENAMSPQEFQRIHGVSPFMVDKINDPQVRATQGMDALAELPATPAFMAADKQAKKGTLFSRQLGGIIKDVPDDFRQMGSNIRDRFSERADATGENIARRQEQGGGLGSSIATGFDWATDAVRGAAIVVEEAGMFGLKQLTTQDQEKAIQTAVSNTIQTGVEAFDGTKLEEDVKKLVAGYNKVKEAHPEKVGAVENVAQILGTFLEFYGIGKGTAYGSKALDTATQVIKETAPKLQDGLEAGARQTGELLDTTLATRRASQVVDQERKVQTAVGRILQAGDDPRAIEQATRALSDIDTKGIQTYDDLNNTLTARITALSRSLDERLSADTNLYTPDQLAKTTRVGSETIREDAVTNAIRGLENAYELSGEPVSAARVRQLASKYEQEGLLLLEINNLAREYGIEFRSRAFTKLGEPKQGYNADLYENTRKAVKTTLRDQMPDDLARQLDSQMSDVYGTLDLTYKLENTVAKLEQRITNRTLGQKVGGAITATADLITGGILRGAVTKLLPSNVGNKAMNSLEIQKELRRNLDELEKLSNMKNDTSFATALQKWAEEIQPGMSIRSTVRPETVAKKLDKEDIKNVSKIIDNPDTRIEYEGMLKAMGLENATDAELVRFLTEVVDEFRGVADRNVIQ